MHGFVPWIFLSVYYGSHRFGARVCAVITELTHPYIRTEIRSFALCSVLLRMMGLMIL